eukprot:snap_masked-scaffold79_size400133-processed-gene-1.8 protein:Tk03955 transcript:snap_masked-scaffold79_size400133-processed-gene-1.8-mRNA-1 annotation:"autotransporter adhesin aae"
MKSQRSGDSEAKIMELYLAGYKFFVLDNIFFIHLGQKIISRVKEDALAYREWTTNLRQLKLKLAVMTAMYKKDACAELNLSIANRKSPSWAFLWLCTMSTNATLLIFTMDYANVPAKLAGSMAKDKKPFTYLPGGLDFSEIKSPRMAKRLARHQENIAKSEMGGPPQRNAAAPPQRNVAAPPSMQSASSPHQPMVHPNGTNGTTMTDSGARPTYKKQRSISDMLSWGSSDSSQPLPPITLDDPPFYQQHVVPNGIIPNRQPNLPPPTLPKPMANSYTPKVMSPLMKDSPNGEGGPLFFQPLPLMGNGAPFKAESGPPPPPPMPRLGSAPPPPPPPPPGPPLSDLQEDLNLHVKQNNLSNKVASAQEALLRAKEDKRREQSALEQTADAPTSLRREVQSRPAQPRLNRTVSQEDQQRMWEEQQKFIQMQRDENDHLGESGPFGPTKWGYEQWSPGEDTRQPDEEQQRYQAEIQRQRSEEQRRLEEQLLLKEQNQYEEELQRQRVEEQRKVEEEEERKYQEHQRAQYEEERRLAHEREQAELTWQREQEEEEERQRAEEAVRQEKEARHKAEESQRQERELHQREEGRRRQQLEMEERLKQQEEARRAQTEQARLEQEQYEREQLEWERYQQEQEVSRRQIEERNQLQREREEQRLQEEQQLYEQQKEEELRLQQLQHEQEQLRRQLDMEEARKKQFPPVGSLKPRPEPIGSEMPRMEPDYVRLPKPRRVAQTPPPMRTAPQVETLRRSAATPPPLNLSNPSSINNLFDDSFSNFMSTPFGAPRSMNDIDYKDISPPNLGFCDSPMSPQAQFFSQFGQWNRANTPKRQTGPDSPEPVRVIPIKIDGRRNSNTMKNPTDRVRFCDPVPSPPRYGSPILRQQIQEDDRLL